MLYFEIKCKPVFLEDAMVNNGPVDLYKIYDGNAILTAKIISKFNLLFKKKFLLHKIVHQFILPRKLQGYKKFRILF